MRLIIVLASIAALCVAPALADMAAAPAKTPASTTTSASGQKMKACAARWNAMTPAQKLATTYKAFSGKCLAAGPAAPPAGSTAQCKDGTYTAQKVHSGACSRHGGVVKWL